MLQVKKPPADRLPSIVSEQVVFVPLQSAVQNWNDSPGSGSALRITWVPAVKVAEHVLGSSWGMNGSRQEMPPLELVTVPRPLTNTSSVWVGSGSNWADTVWFEVIVTVQPPVPEHPPPLQDTNSLPGLASWLKPTLDWKANGALHVELQLLMPAGFELTVPLPDPVT